MALSPKTAKEIARAEERAAKSAERAAKASKERAAVEKDLTEYAKIRHQLSLKGIGKAEYLAAKAQAREEKKITKEKIRRRIIDFVFILYFKLKNPSSISLASTYSITACPAVI